MLSRIDFLVRILQSYHPRQGTDKLEDLIARAFSSVAGFDANCVLACDETHLAVCAECQEAQRTFQGKSWTELGVATERLPRYFAGLGFLRPEARQFLFPAYLIAALRDKDAEWLEIARSAGISENTFAVPQRDLIEFVVQVASQEKALPGDIR